MGRKSAAGYFPYNYISTCINLPTRFRIVTVMTARNEVIKKRKNVHFPEKQIYEQIKSLYFVLT